MININELRIGNWTYYPRTQDELYQIEYPRQIELSYILKPIPISKEWLESCEFVASKEPDEPLLYSILKMDLYIAKMEDGYYLRTNNTDPYHNTNIGRKIEFVHHLQNIYHALTGEELNVKL